MPLMLESHDSLPYVDSNLTPSHLDVASALLATEVGEEKTADLHPSISTSYEPTFSTLIKMAHSQIASGGSARIAGTGVDLSRYEEPSAPSSSSDHQAWRAALSAAYISQAYLSERQLNLSLLEKYGKNAWLIGNSQIEEQARHLDKELADVKRMVQEVEEERRQRQESVRGEMEGLEQSWRTTVGRAIETEVAAEGLRREMLKRQRTGV